MAKRKEYEDDDFLDESIDELIEDDEEDKEEEEDSGEEASDDDSGEEVAEEPELEPEEEEDYPPDDAKAVAALKKLGVRLDVSEKGNIWRVIFDDTNGKDPALVLLNGLPGLKEAWLIGTKITDDAAKELKEQRPKVTVYH